MNKKTTTALLRFWARVFDPIRVDRVIPLDVKLGDLSVKIWFGVLVHLSVEALLGIFLKYHFV